MGAEAIGPIAMWTAIALVVLIGGSLVWSAIARSIAGRATARDDLEEAKKAAKAEGKAEDEENKAPTSPGELDDALQRSLRDGGES